MPECSVNFSRRLATADNGEEPRLAQTRGDRSRAVLYASALIDDKGYDDLAALKGLTNHQAEEIADNVQMKPGHKRAFIAAFVAEAPVAVQPASQPQRTFSVRAAAEPLAATMDSFTMDSVKDLSAFGTSVHYMKGQEDCECCWSCVEREDLTLL